MLGHKRVVFIVALLGIVLVTACSGLGSSSPTGQPTEVAGMQPPMPVGTTPPAPSGPTGPTGQLVITGQVRKVDAATHVITFVEPVHGLESVALTDQTQIEDADGRQRTFQDIKPGVVVQVAGTASGSGSVLASVFRILTVPSPIPQQGASH